MAQFRFQLEAVLRHRKNIEKDRQRQVAVIHGQMQLLENELRALDQSMRDASGELRSTGLVGRLDMNYIAAHRRFVAATQRKAMGVAQRMALVQRQLDEARKVLSDAAVQRKVMEKLREKHHQRWLEALNKKEANEMDEIGMQLAYRNIGFRAAAGEGGDVA